MRWIGEILWKTNYPSYTPYYGDWQGDTIFFVSVMNGSRGQYGKPWKMNILLWLTPYRECKMVCLYHINLWLE